MSIVETILAYLINLASGERSAAIADSRERNLRELFLQEEALKKALASLGSIRDEVRLACAELARSKSRLGVTAKEEPVWRLLSDDSFQVDLAEWLMAGAIEEGNAAKDRLLQAMERALAGGNPNQIAFLKSGYLDALEKAVFSNPILAQWRHQLSLEYLREQVAVLRRHAEEAAGLYSAEKQHAALDRYCAKALAAWDIIDLSNLPEGDIHMTTQQLLLRQLYMPLRIEIEPRVAGEGDGALFARMEKSRETRRRREAGHLNDGPADLRKRRAPVGERLAASRRLVVLGDPGGGKTTMLRWMATAYLLQQNDAAFRQVPDTQTLPGQPWVPVLIRCRDLGEADLCRCFIDFLTQHLNKTELLPGEAQVMRAVILDRIAKGEALLLVDGLDEITNPHVRMTFCQELERTAVRYPNAPIVVTSRIVGYRDMPYRMGSGFEHCQIAELDRDDKDLFARRWVDVTEQHQLPDEKAKRVQELLDALHSNDRIERLTGNPMLLTTLALVKRKVGKLPNKRTKLYAEAVSVLLNWNPRHYQIIEEDEAIPQLEYIAYEMCRRGVQRLADDEVLDLLDKLRVEYPNIRAIKRREPQAFLKHLEERSSIFIKSGGIWEKNTKQEKPVWEFRHLTFQEYLAARALLDGRFPGRDKSKSLAEQVALLASAVKQTRDGIPEEVEVPESWREALRLLVADCKDDDVDDVLQAILTPTTKEDPKLTSRARGVLAALCLADEPNVSESTGKSVIERLVSSVSPDDGKGAINTPLDVAAVAVGRSMWNFALKEALVNAALLRPFDQVGSLWGAVEYAVTFKQSDEASWLSERVDRLRSDSPAEKFSAAMALCVAACHGIKVVSSQLSTLLLDMVKEGGALVEPAVETLYWLTSENAFWESNTWIPTLEDCKLLAEKFAQSGEVETHLRQRLIKIISKCNEYELVEFLTAHIDHNDKQARWSIIGVLGQLGDKRAVAPLLAQLDDQDTNVQQTAIAALGELGDKRAVEPLLAKLDDQSTYVRRAAIIALGQMGDIKAVGPLLAKLDDKKASVQGTIIAALGQLGDKRAVGPLLGMLDDQKALVQGIIIAALGQLGDKRAVAPLLAKLDNQDTNVQRAAIAALGELGDKRAVAPLLAKLDDKDTNVRRAAIAALGGLGDLNAVGPLLGMLGDQNADVRKTLIYALGQLGDKRSVGPLLAKIDDQNADVGRVAIDALGQLGDTEAVGPLLAKLDSIDTHTQVAAAVALFALGEPRGTARVNSFLGSEDPGVRQSIVRSYAILRDISDRKLLSKDMDGVGPWLDPKEHISEYRINWASRRLRLTTDEVRSRYQAMASALTLKFK